MVIAARRLQQLEETAVALRALSKDTKILVVQTDIAVEKDVESLFKQVRDTFGRPADVVLANAGIMSDKADAGEDPVDNWWKSYVSLTKIWTGSADIANNCRRSM